MYYVLTCIGMIACMPPQKLDFVRTTNLKYIAKRSNQLLRRKTAILLAHIHIFISAQILKSRGKGSSICSISTFESGVGIIMHSQQLNSMQPQSQCHTTHGLASRVITKEVTGNAKSDTGEPVEKINIGSVSVSEKLTLLQGSTGDNIIASEKFNVIPTLPQFADRNDVCNQKSHLKCLTTYVDKQCVFSELQCSRSNSTTSNNQVNVQLENKQVIQTEFSKSKKINLKSVKCKPEYQGNQYHSEKSSDIYGAVGNSPFSIFGSWALRNQSNMQQGSDFGLSNDLRAAKENESFLVKNMEVKCKSDHVKESGYSDTLFRGCQWWNIYASAGTLFQIRASHLVKLICMLVLLMIAFCYLFHSRIKVLEEEKNDLLGELNDVKMHVQLLVQRMEDVVNLAIPARSQRKQFAAYETEQQDEGNKRNVNDPAEFSSVPIERQSIKVVVKRSAVASRTTKELMYPTNSIGLNSLNNETTPTSFGSKMDDWTVSSLERPKASKGNGKSKNGFSSRKFIRRLFRKELRKLRNAHRLQTKSLQQQLKQSQQQIFSANLSCCNNNGTLQNSLSSAAQSAYGISKVRAVYLQLDGSSINIKPRQLIGPWYLPDTGNDIDFNDMWYNQLTLDSNGTSIVFKEDGLYLISAQVFYQLQHSHNSKPTPMGYRVHLKKNGKVNHAYKRPLTIAECVPSFPSTVYQTCFTQVAWYIEAQDEVYLEHFTDSLPTIEALRPGQTFLGLVRLN